MAPNLRMILDDKRPFELPPAPKTAFHKWCEANAAEIIADRATASAMQPKATATQSQQASNPKLSPTPKPSEAKPAAASEELTSSTPWSIIVVLIVATGCLLWLLLKRRS